MVSRCIVLCASLMLARAALAQSENLPPDIARLPDQIKSLKWQSIDTAALAPLERCRALLLLNHTLDELSANATAEADLMSAYIEKQNLGSQFASTPPPPAPPQLTFADAEKVAIALLKGPMSDSYFATELGDVSPAGLQSYEQLYERTCQRRWSEYDESRTQVRAMASFLGNSQKLADYEGWATAEAALRQKQHEQKLAGAAQQQAAAAVHKSDAQMQQLIHQNEQLRQALSAAEHQRQVAAQQAASAQQAAAQSQQQTPSTPQEAQAFATEQTALSGGGAYYGGYYGYGGYGYGGGAAAAAYAGAYHGASSAWNKEPAYASAARAQTEQRMSGFHGAPAARRR